MLARGRAEREGCCSDCVNHGGPPFTRDEPGPEYYATAVRDVFVLVLFARPDPGGEGFDRIDDGLEAYGVEAVEHMLCPWQLGVDDRLG